MKEKDIDEMARKVSMWHHFPVPKERRKTFKELVDEMSPIEPRYKPLEKDDVIFLPEPGYGKFIEKITGKNTRMYRW